MTNLIALAVAVHVIAAIVWVGGMFFAYVVLRPSVGVLEPPSHRLKLWNQVFGRFFLWVWGAIVLLVTSGYYLVFAVYGAFTNVGLHIHMMYSIALIMVLLFFWMYFGPYRHFVEAAGADDWPTAGETLPRIRRIVGVNLILGLLTAAIGASGKFWL